MTDTMTWWKTDLYVIDAPILPELVQYAGPHGIALVGAYADGKTDPGWGRDTFMALYNGRRQFRAAPILAGYNKGRNAFAFVMRSLRLICIDIDGKNGGLEHAKHLGPLPATLAETSKSGNGYHLFYSVEDDWSDTEGFACLPDTIGIVQGVDIRYTGCVYHHPTQRWNGRAVAPLPKYMLELLENRQQKQAARAQRVTSIISSGDDLEILMLKDELMRDLAADIPDGRRNNTLFAIGQKMKAAGIENWDEKIRERADDLGLDDAEINRLVKNIDTYATPVAP